MINPDTENIYLIKELNLKNVEIEQNLDNENIPILNYKLKGFIILIFLSVSVLIIVRNQKLNENEKK